MSESTPYTPASTITFGNNETVSLADEIKKYDTAKLIEYLQGQEDLGLSESALKILENEEIRGSNFLDMTEQKFRDCGLKIGPAMTLAKFAKDCKEKKKRAFSSYRSLEEVLEKYGIKSNTITSIPQFTPVPHPIDEKSPEFNRKEDNLTQFSTSSDYYDIRCLQHSLDLRTSTLQQTNSGKTDNISRRESESLGQSNKKHAISNGFASNNGELDILERNFEKKGEGCEIYLRCINQMPSTNECGVSGIKSEQYEDVEMGRGRGINRRGKTRVQAQVGELLRVGVLGGMEWTTEFPSGKCRFVHAHNQPQEFNNEGSMSFMQECTRNDKEISKYNNTHYTLVDTLKNKFQQHNIATSIGREDLIDTKSDPKKLDYYIASVAEFGFNHIIIIGEVDYGMLFLDCYGRVFLWEDMNQFIYPLANSLEEIPKHTNKEKEKDLAWFVKDGMVYEYFMEPGISTGKKKRNLKKKKNSKK